MTDSEEKILDIFRKTGALMEGHFILRSGLHSGHFFQCARVCEHMDRVTELVSMLVKKLGDIDCQTVIAPAMGGLVLGQEVARQMGKRFIFAEKKDDKLCLRRNFQIAQGEKILIIEDGNNIKNFENFAQSNSVLMPDRLRLTWKQKGRGSIFHKTNVSPMEIARILDGVIV